MHVGGAAPLPGIGLRLWSDPSDTVEVDRPEVWSCAQSYAWSHGHADISVCPDVLSVGVVQGVKRVRRLLTLFQLKICYFVQYGRETGVYMVKP